MTIESLLSLVVLVAAVSIGVLLLWVGDLLADRAENRDA